MNLEKILDEIPKLRALVVGDVCLDCWCTYDPGEAEPSRETGIPRIAVVRTEVTPGAAGTIANNLVALGAREVAVLGTAGEDGHGLELERALRKGNISAKCLIRSPLTATFTYTKLINSKTGAEDRARVDFINTRELPREIEERMAASLEEAEAYFDVILVSDQAETAQGGAVTARVREVLERIAPRKLVWVDSRMRAEHFRGTILKLNRDEAAAAAQRACGGVDYSGLRKHTRGSLLLVTHGGDGVLVVDDSGENWIHGRPIENPVDICGAGDSFSAGASLAFALTGSAMDAVEFGNLVASITIMKKGTGTASPAELRAASKK